MILVPPRTHFDFTYSSDTELSSTQFYLFLITSDLGSRAIEIGQLLKGVVIDDDESLIIL